ncbi:MAG: hypothetical protein WC708_17490 [Lentisphaeria bacterium]
MSFHLIPELKVRVVGGDLRAAAAAWLGIKPADLRQLRLLRRSLDARDHRQPLFLCRVAVDLPDDWRPRQSLRLEPWAEPAAPEPLRIPLADAAPVVVGAGPAGLFAALALAEAGLPPRLLERGRPVPERAADVAAFWEEGRLNPESNVYFGEGGAGTFSDGKLYTRAQSPELAHILRELHAAGAPEEILFDPRAHLGTDGLARVIPNLRRRLESLGVRFEFGARLEGVTPLAGGGCGLRINGGDGGRAWPLVLATGHSALDTYRLLAAAGAAWAPKDLAIGCRIEHPAALITRRFHGQDPAVLAALGNAGYNLSVALRGGGSVYSFCCCPGGEIVAGAVVPETLSVNGMSFSRRDGRFTNAGLVTPVKAAEIAATPEGMLRWREELENDCYRLGGGGYALPAQRAADFLAGEPSRTLPASSCRRPLTPGELGRLLPAAVAGRLREGLRLLDRQLPGWIRDGLLVGVETTTSSPVRLLRTPHGDSETLPGVLPVGEGSGYAGGILTSALDGWRTVRAWLAARAPL